MVLYPSAQNVNPKSTQHYVYANNVIQFRDVK